MRVKIALCLLGLVVSGTASPSLAQTDVDVHTAALAAGFGAHEGTLVTVIDQLIFVDTGNPTASFAIAHRNIARLDRDQDVVTVVLREPVRSQSQLIFRVDQPVEISRWFEGFPVV